MRKKESRGAAPLRFDPRISRCRVSCRCPHLERSFDAAAKLQVCPNSTLPSLLTNVALPPSLAMATLTGVPLGALRKLGASTKDMLEIGGTIDRHLVEADDEALAGAWDAIAQCKE